MKEKDPNFKVPVTRILEIASHPNPKVYNLLIAKVYDFDVIISKNSGLEVGSRVVYLPVNSILPPKLENFLFPPDCKIKLTKSRVKAAKIHKCVSYGMVCPWEEIRELYSLPQFKDDTDLQDHLNVVKYYPPVRVLTPPKEGREPRVRNKVHENEYFKKYNGCTNLKWVPNVFEETDDVYITEKIHGSNLRVGWLPYEHKLSLWQKIKKFFGINLNIPTHEYCYGSNNVQRQNKQQSETYYGSDVYSRVIQDYNLKEILKQYPGYVIYGEIYGPTIQKGYGYGLQNDNIKFVLFDILEQKKDSERWLSYDEVAEFCATWLLPQVPLLYRGKWNKELAENLAKGDSVFCPTQKVIEGVVVKHDNITSLNRAKIKIINPEYTMKESTGETTDEQEIE